LPLCCEIWGDVNGDGQSELGVNTSQPVSPFRNLDIFNGIGYGLNSWIESNHPTEIRPTIGLGDLYGSTGRGELAIMYPTTFHRIDLWSDDSVLYSWKTFKTIPFPPNSSSAEELTRVFKSLGDVNGLGKPEFTYSYYDLVTSKYKTLVYAGITLAWAYPPITLDGYPLSITMVGDVDGDNNLDFAIAMGGADAFATYPGIISIRSGATGNEIYRITGAAGDKLGDYIVPIGKLSNGQEILISSYKYPYSVQEYLLGKTSPQYMQTFNNLMQPVSAGDQDNDGFSEWLGVTPFDNTIHLMKVDGTILSTCSSTSNLIVNDLLAVADSNGNGRKEFAVVLKNQNKVFLMEYQPVIIPQKDFYFGIDSGWRKYIDNDGSSIYQNNPKINYLDLLDSKMGLDFFIERFGYGTTQLKTTIDEYDGDSGLIELVIHTHNDKPSYKYAYWYLVGPGRLPGTGYPACLDEGYKLFSNGKDPTDKEELWSWGAHQADIFFDTVNSSPQNGVYAGNTLFVDFENALAGGGFAEIRDVNTDDVPALCSWGLIDEGKRQKYYLSGSSAFRQQEYNGHVLDGFIQELRTKLDNSGRQEMNIGIYSQGQYFSGTNQILTDAYKFPDYMEKPGKAIPIVYWMSQYGVGSQCKVNLTTGIKQLSPFYNDFSINDVFQYIKEGGFFTGMKEAKGFAPVIVQFCGDHGDISNQNPYNENSHKGFQPVLKNDIHMSQYETKEINVTVLGGLSSETFSNTWSGSDIVMSLISPTGRIIDRSTTASDVFHRKIGSAEFYEILFPETGEWKVRLYGADVPASGEAVHFTTVEKLKPEDNTPPVIVSRIEGVTGENGWYTSNVKITWNVDDPESGIISINDCEDITLTDDTAGSTQTCTAMNSAGLKSIQSVSIKIDKTLPTISIASPGAKKYLHSDQITTSWIISDEISGIFSTQIQLDGVNVTNGQVLDLLDLALGTHKLVIIASDKAGNTSTQSVEFTVSASIDSLINSVQKVCDLGWISNKGICNSLQVKLNAAKDSLTRGDATTATNQLNAFLTELSAQKGKKINQKAYDLLSIDALFIINSLITK
jgi:hypothetical protein